jgi:sigma-B regulation protein RsbU (phosphoserine phosphatase)
VASVQEAVVHGLIAEGKSVVLDRLRSERSLAGDGIPEAFLCTVIKTDGRVYGALCVGRRDARTPFTAGDLKLARVMATQAAIAIENALLHKRRMEEQQAMIRIQEEIRLARTIQANLLPKEAPVVPGYDVAGATLPARSVGGDYYDFIPMADGRLALCLGDVSGKGMPAAMLMAHLQAAIRGQTLMSASPSQCLARSNTLLFASTDYDRFATCFYGILDLEEHCLRFANAGHDRPIHIREDAGLVTLDSGGIVLGVLEEAGYTEQTVSLAPGEAMVLYSDGIIDATDERDNEFGLETLRRIIEANRDAPPAVLIERILAAVNAHAGDEPQTDDMTLVVLRRNP